MTETGCIPSALKVPHIGQAPPLTDICKVPASNVPVTTMPSAKFFGGDFVMPMFASLGNPHMPQCHLLVFPRRFHPLAVGDG